MDISDVSKLTNLPASTLRYYEEKGLIQPIGRHGLKRYYSPSVINTLSFISLGRNAGLSLDDIHNMLLPNGFKVDRELLIAKADELDKKIAEIAAIRDGLRHAAACKEDNHSQCPKFIRLLNVAGKNKKRIKKQL